jgi:hypothetical protein
MASISVAGDDSLVDKDLKREKVNGGTAPILMADDNLIG